MSLHFLRTFPLKKISFKELNELWLRDDISRGVDIPKRTFDNWRYVIWDMFGISIVNENRVGLPGSGNHLHPALDAGGIRQSGGFRLAENCSDTELMNHAFGHAREMLTDDPELTGYPELRRTVEQMYARSGNILN